MLVSEAVFRLKQRFLGVPVPASVLQIDTPDKQKVAGLFNLTGWAHTASDSEGAGQVEVSLDGTGWTEVSWRFPTKSEQFGNAPRAGFRLTINSHRLPNGWHTVRVRLKDADGRTLRLDKRTFLVDNTGRLAEAVSTELKRHGSPVLITGHVDSSLFPELDSQSRAWFDLPDAKARLPKMMEKYGLDARYQPALEQFIDEGYLILENFLTPDHADRINREVDEAIASGVVNYPDKSGQRIEHMFMRSPAVRELWLNPDIVRIMDTLFDDKALACQTLNYVHGSTQDVHQDTIHLTPYPEGYMCGVWVSLEDIHPDAGPLFVYPKSHRLPVFYTSTVGMKKVTTDWAEYETHYLPSLKKALADRGLEPFYYTPKIGSVLIWHSNLAHGGSSRKNWELSRKSMVSHYFARGGIAYYDSTGTPGHVELNR